MPIFIDESTKTFHLQTKNTSYIFAIYCGKYPVHLHFGKKIKDAGAINTSIDFTSRASFAPEKAAYLGMDGSIAEETGSIEVLPLEYAFYGHPDLRTPSFHAQYADGTRNLSA